MRSPRGHLTSTTNILHASALRIASAIALASLAVLVLAAAATAQPLFGTWSPGEPYAGSVAGTDALERATGRRVSIVHWYQNWGGSTSASGVQPQAVRAVTDSGRLPLLTWEPRDPRQGAEQPPYRLAGIAAGAHDAYIASFARGLRDLGTAVYLRPMHEMNGTWYPWGGGVNGNTSRDFVRAWQRMHHIFVAEGASNVLWVWSPNNFDVSPAYPMESFYPGAAYVDVLAADGYNWGSARPQFGGWQTFEQIFQGVYDRLKALGPQPIWIAEVASAPDGGDKAAWVRDMFARAEGMDRLQALVWFNEFKELDWRADANGDVAAAFTPLPLGSASPVFEDSGGGSTDSGTAAQSPTSTTGSTTPRPSSGRTRTAGGGPGSAAYAADGDAGAPGSASAASVARRILRIHTRKRVRAGRRSVVRWKAIATHRVRRWVVYLDGRRVHSVTADRGRSHRLGRRSVRVGTHRWRIEGRDADGRRVVWASRSFRVVRAR